MIAVCRRRACWEFPPATHRKSAAEAKKLLQGPDDVRREPVVEAGSLSAARAAKCSLPAFFFLAFFVLLAETKQKEGFSLTMAPSPGRRSRGQGRQSVDPPPPFLPPSQARRLGGKVGSVHSSVVLQDKRWDVDLLRPDAGEELLQVVQVADLLLEARHAEGGEEPRGDL